MKKHALGIALAAGCVALGSCGGTSKVSSSSLEPRLLPPPPGLGRQRTQEWSDLTNLVGEHGVAFSEQTRPSTVVTEFEAAKYEGGTGEVLTKGSGLEQTSVQVGVAKVDSSPNAEKLAAWMHKEDLKQPCYSQCSFAPASMPINGLPNVKFVTQTSKAVTSPHGVMLGPTNYRAEFVMGDYIYWLWLQASEPARTQVEAGIKLYYEHARQFPTT